MINEFQLISICIRSSVLHTIALYRNKKKKKKWIVNKQHHRFDMIYKVKMGWNSLNFVFSSSFYSKIHLSDIVANWIHKHCGSFVIVLCEIVFNAMSVFLHGFLFHLQCYFFLSLSFIGRDFGWDEYFFNISAHSSCQQSCGSTLQIEILQNEIITHTHTQSASLW